MFKEYIENKWKWNYVNVSIDYLLDVVKIQEVRLLVGDEYYDFEDG